METLNKTSKEKQRDLWKKVNLNKYQIHVTISSLNSTIKSEKIDDRIIYMDEIEKRKEVYGICGECNEPGTDFLNEIKSYLQIYSESIKTHPQAIYTSRLLNFKDLPEPVNSSDLSSFQINADYIPSVSENLISECFDVQFSESDLNEINQEDNLNDES
ncbi:unnamed protein product [Rhizophagus irregularis]|nr:unnamed protein product [Rhizophagus irregularis]